VGTGVQGREEDMKCVFCRHGETRPGEITTTLQRGETTVILKRAPADVCDNCGEAYLSAEVTGEVLAKAEAAVKSGPRWRFCASPRSGTPDWRVLAECCEIGKCSGK
jgi:YgiT-type zinc finger domain-containing protein